MADEFDLPTRPGLTLTLDDLASIVDRSGPGEAITFIKQKYGNRKELLRLLQTHEDDGISHLPQDVSTRKEMYGTNSLYEVEEAGVHGSIWSIIQSQLLKEVRLVVILVLAVISFGLSFGDSDLMKYSYFFDMEEQKRAGWIGALCLFVLTLFIFTFQVVSTYFLDAQYSITQRKRQLFSMAQVYTIRGSAGVYQPRDEIVVGDIIYVKCGSTVPADGLIIYSNNLKVNEFRVTGLDTLVDKSANGDAILLKGSKVIDGRARMVVLQVGRHTKLDIARSSEVQVNIAGNEGGNTSDVATQAAPRAYSPLGSQPIRNKKKKSVLTQDLNRVSKYVLITAIVLCILIGLAVVINFCYQTFVNDGSTWDIKYLKDIVDLVIVTVTVFTITYPSFLPSIYHHICKMSAHEIRHDQIYVCNVEAYGIMGNITTLLTNKTGVITENYMRVEDIFIFNEMLHINWPERPHNLISKLEMTNATLLLTEGMSVNTDYTSQIIENPGYSNLEHVGDRTDCALLEFVNILGGHYRAFRDSNPEDKVMRVYPFNTSRKMMCSVIAKEDLNVNRVYCKGAAERVLKRCTTFLDSKGMPRLLDGETRAQLISKIEEMSMRKLRTICLAYRDMSIESTEEESVDLAREDEVISDLTCIALLGISDRVRQQAAKYVRALQRSGIRITMVTGDVLQTAGAVARESGIVRSNKDLCLNSDTFNLKIHGLPMNEPVYATSITDNHKIIYAEFNKIWPRLKVLAQAQPEDKQCLARKIPAAPSELQPQLVAVTGRYIGDEETLAEADLGIALGNVGSVEAKTAADVILKDDSIFSIRQAVMWGRNIWDGVVKFVQSQLVRGMVTSLIAFIGACTFSNCPIRAIQVLWSYLLVDVSIILLADKPTRHILKYKALGSDNHMISELFIVTVLSHFVYQITVLLVFIYKGAELFDIDDGLLRSPSAFPTQHMTMVFNVFMLMQIFNQLNERKVHGQQQIYKGLYQIRSLVYLVELVAQVLIVQNGNYGFGTKPLDLDQWLWCLAFGIGTLLWHQIVLIFYKLINMLVPLIVNGN
ncbi:plasma membrane calcium-transporting ATPase 3-like isoform X2 [Anneissia japonica]|uniref:plasma membrane calcium-transporting ATPase 3-like isoform X2 n=1 Tax=Anneissia japonica TaxID=1529436 RepID=UPI001425B4B9|nr:plasma membrane calcium-transporting ATPase 3-like isoform X2 [Anneissia japonica]